MPQRTFAYDDDNRVLTLNGVSLNNDDDGNLTNGPLSPGASNGTLVYDSRNRLIQSPGVTYRYDSQGRRLGRSDAGQETRFTIDPNGSLSRCLQEIVPDGTRIRYVYGKGLCYSVHDSGDIRVFHFDQVGNTIVRTDDNGNVVGRAEYSPYGTLALSEGDLDTPFLYNGQSGVYTDPSGLLCMRARYYSPYLMRFLNADPIRFEGGQNWYLFGNGNPISLSDPKGLQAMFSSPATTQSFFSPANREANDRAANMVLEIAPVTGSITAVGEVLRGENLNGEPVHRGMAAVGIGLGVVPFGKVGGKFINRILGRGGDDALVHMSPHADEILDGGQLGLSPNGSNIYVGPSSLAESGPVGLMTRAGLTPGFNYGAVPIPQAANRHFSQVTPTGLISGWQALMGHRYSQRGILDLSTGAFQQTGRNWNQIGTHVVDFGIVSGAAYIALSPK